ncbi:MAG: FAD-dependent oxidoreductase [Halodesulfurarchaeum sp.]
MDDDVVHVRAVRSVGVETVALTFEAPTGFDAAPGQFIQVSARIDDDLVQRYFTISSPGVDETFEITVDVDPEGTLAPWLAGLDPGDTVRMDGPFGSAYYEGEPRAVVLGAGPGIGPAIGIGERAIELGNQVAIVVPPDTDTHEDRLQELSTDGAFVTEAREGLEAATAQALDQVDGTLFVYGFAPFVSDAVEAIAAAGRDPDEAKIESFGPG